MLLFWRRVSYSHFSVKISIPLIAGAVHPALGPIGFIGSIKWAFFRSLYDRLNVSDCQKSPVQPTCADGRDTYRTAANFVPRGSGDEARPVDEAASRHWRSAPIFASARAPRKPAKRKRIRGKEFLSRGCAQKWVPPKARCAIADRPGCRARGPAPGAAHRSSSPDRSCWRRG